MYPLASDEAPCPVGPAISSVAAKTEFFNRISRVRSLALSRLPTVPVGKELPTLRTHVELTCPFSSLYRIFNLDQVAHDVAVLMPKAPLFLNHFDWIPIGDSEMIVVTFVQGASSPGRALRAANASL